MDSFAQWREAARALLAAGVPPHAAQWPSALADAGVFSGAPAPAPRPHTERLGPDLGRDPSRPALRLPRQLMELLERAACYRAADRWAFLYRVVWRWLHGEQGVLSEADDDGHRLQAMVQAVHREEHDMQNHIRFRERPADAGAPRFVAWCEPVHDVLPQVAAQLAARMGKLSWMIATPAASVLWDGARLHNTGPLLRDAAGFDEGGEAPWLAYYRSVYAGPPDAAGKREAPPTHNVAGKPEAPEQQPDTLGQCRRCDLWQHATQPVGGAGAKRARIMLVGEQPGDQEDLAGKPFVGPAGQLLDRVLAAAEVDRRTVYVTNSVNHFNWELRGKRRLHKTPAQREIEACSYWLEKELAGIKPKVVVALGSTALKAVLDNPQATLKDAMGHPIAHAGRWVVAVYHPSYVLRVPDKAAKEQAFAQMVEGLRLARQLSEEPPQAAP